MVRAPLLVVAALAAGCTKPDPPTVAPERMSLTRIDLSGIALDVSIRATNPNSAPLTVSGVSSRLVIDKHDVGAVALPKTLTLPAGVTTTLDVPVTLSWPDMGLLAQLALDNEGVPYSVDGSLDMGGNLLRVSVPFHIEGVIPHAQIEAAVMKSLPMPH